MSVFIYFFNKYHFQSDDLQVPKPWHALPPPRHPNKRNTSHEAPSRSGLAIKLTRYAPKTWRGHNPDSRQLLERPRSPDAAWDDDPYSELLGKLKYSGEMIDKIEGMAGQIHEVLVGRLSTIPQLRLSTLPELKRQLRMMEVGEFGLSFLFVAKGF
jgi:hypothetical protein